MHDVRADLIVNLMKTMTNTVAAVKNLSGMKVRKGGISGEWVLWTNDGRQYGVYASEAEANARKALVESTGSYWH